MARSRTTRSSSASSRTGVMVGSVASMWRASLARAASTSTVEAASTGSGAVVVTEVGDLHTGTDEGEAGLEDDGLGDHDGREHHDGRHAVDGDVAEHDVAAPGS